MPTKKSIVQAAGQVAIVVAALLLPACWFSIGDGDGDGGGGGRRSCSDEPLTVCSNYGQVGVRQEGSCSYTYYDCDERCRADGWVRSAGCDWEPRSSDYRCMCTNDETCECAEGGASCWNDDTILYCNGGCYWEGYDCDDVCREAGYDRSVGCDYDAEAGEDACFCTDEPECECATGDYLCSSDFTILACDGCYWYEYDCDDVCYDNGGGYSTGCGYDSYYGGDSCFCETEAYDDPGYDTCECAYGDYACWDSYSIASCDDGCYWYVSDCDDICWEYGYDYSTGCGYDSYYGGDSCFCEMY